jgi:superfamily II RNA helicase
MPINCDKPYTKENEIFNAWPFKLSDFQKYAIESILLGNNTIITAHTGSGKTLPAGFSIEHFKKMGKKLIYTTPIKALSNEKFNDFKGKYPEISFGIITGDIKFNPEADVLIMTTECFLNTLYQMKMIEDGTLETTQVDLLFEMDIKNELGCVVFDEIHYINDPDRGHVWEESIMMLPKEVQILGLSATIHKPEKLCTWIEKIKEKPVWLCSSKKRVVPLKHYAFLTLPTSKLEKLPKEMKNLIEDNNFYENSIVIKDTNFEERVYNKINKVLTYFKKNKVWIDKSFVLNRIVDYLYKRDLIPALCFVFSQKKCEEYAECITKVLYESDSKLPSIIGKECRQILMKLPNYQEYICLPEYKKLVRLLEKGIAYHHAGMANVFREMVEMLFSKGFIKLLFATETFSVGINMPTRSVIFTSLKKYSNNGFRFIKSHEYTQMSGRAGRRGIDDVGYIFHLSNFYCIQNSQPPIQIMREIFSSNPPVMESKFKINSNIILKLISIGNNNFEKFIENSFVTDSIKKQSKLFEEDILLLEKKTSEKYKILSETLKDLRTYKEIEEMMQWNTGNRAKFENEMIEIKNKTEDFEKNYIIFNDLKKEENELKRSKTNLYNVENYVKQEIGHILDILEKDKFIEKEDVYILTLKGQMASNINELHPLAMANILDKKMLNEFSTIEIAGILSIFTNVKLSSQNSISNKNSLNFSKQFINAIDKIEKEHEYFHDKQLKLKLDTQSRFLETIHYDLCDFIVDWFEHGSNATDCYHYITVMKEYGMSLGKIIKSILQINNIVDEVEKVSLIQGNFELIEKLRKIKEKTLKFIVTNQTLYL